MFKDCISRLNTRINKALIIVISLILIFSSGMAAPNNAVQVSSPKKPWPLADGTFIQSYLVSTWSDEKWQSELTYLKEANMHYIILQSTADRVDGGRLNTVYPTSIKEYKMYDGYDDVVDACLRNAEKMGFKVFLGLNYDDRWWDGYVKDSKWLYERMEEGNKLAAELYDKYHDRYPGAFYGWYWPWEVDNLNFKTRMEQQVLINALNINLRFLRSTGRRLPFMLSPFMNHWYGNPEEYKNMWVNVLSNTSLGQGDILCPQDSVGAGGLNTDIFGGWFSALRQAVNTKPGVLLWSDTETFDSKEWNSATLDRFVEQLKGVQPYVDNIVTFAYSHYYSPNVAALGFHKAYLYYVNNGVLENHTPLSPIHLKKIKLKNGDISLSWTAPFNTENICGYAIYRDGILIKRIQVPRKGMENTFKTSFVDNIAGRDLSRNYEVKSYDFSGNTSNASE